MEDGESPTPGTCIASASGAGVVASDVTMGACASSHTAREEAPE